MAGGGAGAPGPGLPALRGTVNLTMPLAAWLGWSQSPGQVRGTVQGRITGQVPALDPDLTATKIPDPGTGEIQGPIVGQARAPDAGQRHPATPAGSRR